MEIPVFQGFALRWVNGWAFGPNTLQQCSRKNSAFGNPSLSEPDTNYGALSPSVRSKFLRIKPLRGSQKKTLQFS